MERLFEANKVVELSLSKLNKSSEVPLRRSLLVNKVMNRAKEVASTSEQFMDFADSHNDLRSSRLFATMSASRVDEPRPCTPFQTPFAPRRDLVADNKLTVCQKDPQAWSDIDKMETDITTHNTVLSEILSTEETPAVSWEESKQFDWSDQAAEQSEIISPGKRKYSDRTVTWTGEDTVFSFDENKRFKQSSQLFDSTWSLSPSSISTAPFIAYMYNTGYSSPIVNPLSYSDWPDFNRYAWSSFADHEMPKQPILAY